jgi:hypothetical protein
MLYRSEHHPWGCFDLYKEISTKMFLLCWVPNVVGSVIAIVDIIHPLFPVFPEGSLGEFLAYMVNNAITVALWMPVYIALSRRLIWFGIPEKIVYALMVLLCIDSMFHTFRYIGGLWAYLFIFTLTFKRKDYFRHKEYFRWLR